MAFSFLRPPPITFLKATKTNINADEMTAPSNQLQQQQPANYKAVSSLEEQQQQQQGQSLEDFNAMCQQMISDHRREAQFLYCLPVRERTFANV